MSQTRQERRRAERAAKKEGEQFKMHFELLQPWSTFVMKTQLPPKILEKMIKISDKIVDNAENEKWSHTGPVEHRKEDCPKGDGGSQIGLARHQAHGDQCDK